MKKILAALTLLLAFDASAIDYTVQSYVAGGIGVEGIKSSDVRATSYNAAYEMGMIFDSNLSYDIDAGYDVSPGMTFTIGKKMELIRSEADSFVTPDGKFSGYSEATLDLNIIKADDRRIAINLGVTGDRDVIRPLMGVTYTTPSKLTDNIQYIFKGKIDSIGANYAKENGRIKSISYGYGEVTVLGGIVISS